MRSGLRVTAYLLVGGAWVVDDRFPPLGCLVGSITMGSPPLPCLPGSEQPRSPGPPHSLTRRDSSDQRGMRVIFHKNDTSECPRRISHRAIQLDFILYKPSFLSFVRYAPNLSNKAYIP